MYKYYNLYLNNVYNSQDEGDNVFKINTLNDDSCVYVKIIGELFDGKIYDLVTGKEVVFSRNVKRDYDLYDGILPCLTYYKKEELDESDVVIELKKLETMSRIEKYYSLIDEVEDKSINFYKENSYVNNFIEKFKKKYRKK